MSNIPSSNLLNDALTLVCPEPFLLSRFNGTTTNDIGVDVRTYETPFVSQGSIQPVDRKFYEQFGLDFNKRHIQIWSSTDIEDIYRGRSGDQIGWNLRTWEVVGETEWFEIDGWQTIIAVQVPDNLDLLALRSWAFGDTRSNFSNSNFYQPS